MIFFSLLILVFSVIYIPSSGGHGVELPLNLLVLMTGAVIALILLFAKKGVSNIAMSSVAGITGGAMILFLCALCAPGVEKLPAVMLLLTILFWLLLVRCPLTQQNKRSILRLVFLLGIAQCIISLIQTFLPNESLQFYEYNWLRNRGRPYGIFQQVNLLGSFLASALACGLALLLTTTQAARVKYYQAGLVLMTFILLINQSRTGVLGALLIIAAFTTIWWQKERKRLAITLTLMTIAALAGYWVTTHVSVVINGVPELIQRDYEGSTHERLKILDITWALIKMKPWSGWGYGNFEHQFGQYLLSHPDIEWSGSIVTHPHNELLYLWFQGGIIALTGVLLLIAGWGYLLLKAFRHGRESSTLALLTLPLLVHLNTEYPFYLSFAHLMLFTVLLRLGCIDNSVITGHHPSQHACFVKASGGGLSLLVIFFSLSGLYANAVMTRYERNGLENFPLSPPCYFATQPERLMFDRMVARLIDYNHSRDVKDLDMFMAQAHIWSLHHYNRNILQSRIMIEDFRGNSENVDRLKKQYTRLFNQ